MDAPPHGWSDQQVEQALGNLLRAGVVLAASVVFLGGICYLVQQGRTVPEYATFEGEPRRLREASAILQSALAGHSRGIMQLGLLLLIATPVARVIFSVVAFAVQRDRLYVTVTLIVLVVLLISLAGGRL